MNCVATMHRLFSYMNISADLFHQRRGPYLWITSCSLCLLLHPSFLLISPFFSFTLSALTIQCCGRHCEQRDLAEGAVCGVCAGGVICIHCHWPPQLQKPWRDGPLSCIERDGVCMCVCVCVSKRERGGWEVGKEWKKAAYLIMQNELYMCMCMCPGANVCTCLFLCVTKCVYVPRNVCLRMCVCIHVHLQ